MNIFRRLSWKLTFSYTLVTVCAFLVITLSLGGYLFPKVMLPSSVISPEGLIQNILDGLSPIWSHILSQPTVDRELVTYLMENPVANFVSVPLFQIGSVKFTINSISAARTFLISADGILVGASDLSFPPTRPVGELFPVEKVPGLQAIYEAALAGETDPKLLYSLQGEVNTMWGPARRFTLAIPIFDQEDGTQGRVLGVLVAVLDPFPYQSEIPRHLLVLAWRSLLVFLFAAGIMGAVFGSISANGLTRRFKRFSTATESWSEGDFSRQIEDRSGDELTRLAGRLNAMAQQLQSLLHRKQEMAISEERNRLARDLHDSAKQQALAASFELGTALALCDRDPAGARQHLVEADALVDSVKEELSNLVRELRPLSNEEQDMADTLRDYMVDWSQRNKIELKMDIMEEVPLSLEAREALFRIVQEALANVNRHSAASGTEINLAQEGELIRLVIQDNGCGFHTDVVQGGMGLTSMKERAEGLGGSFTLKSAPGQGTQVTVTLPIEKTR